MPVADSKAPAFNSWQMSRASETLFWKASQAPETRFRKVSRALATLFWKMPRALEALHGGLGTLRVPVADKTTPTFKTLGGFRDHEKQSSVRCHRHSKHCFERYDVRETHYNETAKHHALKAVLGGVYV